MKSEILITGTDGFIGSYLKEFFLNNGYKVFGTVYNLKEPDVNEFKIDFRVEKDFQELPEKEFDIILHTVGIVDQNVPKKKMMLVNAEGTKNICKWAKNHKCKHFLFISSVSAYGYKLLGENRSERKTKRSKGIFGIPYMKAKAKAERYIEKSGLNYTILRLPPVLGKGDTYLSPIIIPRLRNNTFFFCGKKDHKFSTLYIKNLGPIVIQIIEQAPVCEAFNCTDFDITWRTLIEEYATHLNVKIYEQYKSLLSCLKNWKDKHFLLLLAFSRFGCHYPNNKLKKQYNFIPKCSWKEGVKDAVSAYLNV